MSWSRSAVDRIRGARGGLTRPFGGHAVIVFVALTLVGTACGTRVNDDMRRRAALAALGGGSGQGALPGQGLGSSGGVPGVGVPGAAATSGPGVVSGVGGGGSVGAPAPPGGNGGATDVGVTATTITLGNISDLSGPVPGLFEGGVNGTLAYFAYVNSQGGVYGRQLRLNVGDSQLDCGQNQNLHNQMLPKVFSFVGSFSLYDDCGARVLEQHPDVPEVSYALSTRALRWKSYFTPSPLPKGYPTGMFSYWKSKFGDKVKHAASLAPNIPSAIDSWEGIRDAARSVGWEFPYFRKFAPTEQDFTADVQRMQEQGIQIIYLSTSEVSNVAQVKQAADQQNYHPIFIAPVAYAEDFVQLVGGPQAAEGIIGSSLYSMFFNADEARNIPAVGRFQEWMRRVNPNAPINLFAMYSWTAAQLFVEALKAAGPRATRAGLLAQLRKVTSYSGDGVLAPRNPAGRTASQCYLLWEFHNGRFARVDSPRADYRCDGRYYTA